MSINLPQGLAQFWPVLVMVWWALVVVIHVSLMIGVLGDAKAVAQRRGSTSFVAPLIWALAVLPGGVFVVLIYWIIHHSTLNPIKPDTTGTPS